MEICRVVVRVTEVVVDRAACVLSEVATVVYVCGDSVAETVTAAGDVDGEVVVFVVVATCFLTVDRSLYPFCYYI